MFREVDLMTGKELKAKENGFTDTFCMTAKEKEQVAGAFENFLKNNFKTEYFTKALYEHLHQHCGFIAHYDIHGFYATYFEDPEDTTGFLGSLFNDYSLFQSGYEDLGKAFVNSFKKYREGITAYLHNKLVESAEEVMKNAQREYDLRKALADGLCNTLP